MKTILIIVLAFGIMVTSAFSAEPKITETDSGFIVEYTGGQDVKSAAPASSIDRFNFLAGEIERLTSEGEQLIKLNGTESRAEIQQKRDLAAVNQKTLNSYLDEMRRIKGQKGNEVDDLKRKFAEDNARFNREHGLK